jgi:Zn-dependent alcohol dehydrogenase
VALYDAGKIKLATRHYRLEDINKGYADVCAGEVIRGVIPHER